ncbi:MAG: GNAT family N-acetyltransferase [Prolixibacteraceae bacterium]|nr:GNAT family N-acetyltransferase [Prolixibacteraceae bacterium]
MNNIEKNLYEFYRVFETVKNINLTQENGYEIIHAENNFWPQMLFNLDKNTDPNGLIPRILSSIKNEHHASYFIAPEEYISRNHSDLLKENAIIPVKILMGMNIKPKENNIIKLPPEFEISDLINDEHLTDFAQMIRNEFIASDMSFGDEVLKEIKFSKEVQMTGLFYREELISSMLVLIKENVAGLYFIVTQKEFQKMGYATILINFVLNQLHKNGVKEVVLHANHYSLGLYKKLGFINQNRFVIYKKI